MRRRFLDTQCICLGFTTAELSLDVLSWALLDMTQENIEKFMMFNKRRRWSHSSRVKLPLVILSASWFLVSTFLIWILGSKLILSNNESSANLWSATLWVLGHVSHRWTSALNDHFDHCFVVFKDVQLRLALIRICVCGDVVHMRQMINISIPLLFGFGFVILRAVSCCSIGW